MNRQLIIDLIANDLLHRKLLYGLHALHIEAGAYALHLSESIFTLMGYDPQQHTEALYDLYTKMGTHVLSTDFEQLPLLAEEIYEAFELQRMKIQKNFIALNTLQEIQVFMSFLK